MNETLEIDTPENVAFGYDVAGIGTRFMAAMVDTLAIALLELVAYLLMALFFLQGLDGNWPSWVMAVVGMLAFLLMYGYYIFFELVWNGQSLGKRWVGLRVVRVDGMPISIVESLIRNLVRLIDFMPVFYGVGMVTMFLNSQARRLGDFAAGTLVVIDRGPVPAPVPAAAPGFALRLAPDGTTPASTLPVERLGEADILLMQDFFSRRKQLVHPELIAAQILSRLYKKMEIADREVTPLTAGVSLAEILEAALGRTPAQETKAPQNHQDHGGENAGGKAEVRQQ